MEEFIACFAEVPDPRQDDGRRFLANPQGPACPTRYPVDGVHGRIEPRARMVGTDIAWPQGQHARPGSAAAGQAVPVRDVEAKLSTQIAYDLVSKGLKTFEMQSRRRDDDVLVRLFAV